MFVMMLAGWVNEQQRAVHMVMFGEGHLRRAVASYMKHYHLERCHQGIGNRPIEGVPELAEGSVARLERLGGILSHYYRRAA